MGKIHIGKADDESPSVPIEQSVSLTAVSNPEQMLVNTLIQPTIVYVDRPVIEFRDRTIEVPVIQIQERIVEVEKPIIKEKIVYVDKPVEVIKERIVEVPIHIEKEVVRVVHDIEQLLEHKKSIVHLEKLNNRWKLVVGCLSIIVTILASRG